MNTDVKKEDGGLKIEDGKAPFSILHFLSAIPRVLICLALRGYKLVVSPVLHALFGAGGGCRFEPSCSVYFLQAVETHGALGGSWLGVKRLCRCHPWGGCGEDPVPLSIGQRTGTAGARVTNQTPALSGGPNGG